METTSPAPMAEFQFEGSNQAVRFESSSQVTEGVICDVYTFPENPTKDLGIIKIGPGFKTPLQKILQGDRTVEGYVSGRGKLVIARKDGVEEIHEVGTDPREKFSAIVGIGDSMQWQAAVDSNLVAYEVCFPPYQDGRFENMQVEPSQTE